MAASRLKSSKDSQLHTNSNTRLTLVSIIAIHGLNPTNSKGHSESTWTHSGGHSGLQDSLPDKAPNARILLLSYTASPVFGSNRQKLLDHAISALDALKNHRSEIAVRTLHCHWSLLHFMLIGMVGSREANNNDGTQPGRCSNEAGTFLDYSSLRLSFFWMA